MVTVGSVGEHHHLRLSIKYPGHVTWWVKGGDDFYIARSSRHADLPDIGGLT